MISPTVTSHSARAVVLGHFECSLYLWFWCRCSCCSMILWQSANGICWFVCWSRCNHISLDDNPSLRIRVLSLAVTRANDLGVRLSVRGIWWRISDSISWTAFSATGLWLMFLIRPISSWIWHCRSTGSSDSAWKPGAGSTRITARGP